MSYKNGWGVKQDYAKAYELFNKSVEQGRGEEGAGALVNLAYMYMSGTVVEKNYNKAFELLSKAVKMEKSETNSTEAQAVAHYNLGVLYERGGCLKIIQKPKSIFYIQLRMGI